MADQPAWSDLPPALRAALQSAWSALEQHPYGELPLPYRRAIWLALGPTERDTEGPRGEGYRRRVALDKLAVQHVLPIWDAAHPEQDGPRRMLDLAERLMRGETDQRAARAEKDRFAVDVESLDDEEFTPGYVGDAAVHSVATALVDYGPDDDPPDRLDEQLDADQWDASYYAALAASEKGPREPGDNAQSQAKRRDFWRWYLRDAVPAAYRAA